MGAFADISGLWVGGTYRVQPVHNPFHADVAVCLCGCCMRQRQTTTNPVCMLLNADGPVKKGRLTDSAGGTATVLRRAAVHAGEQQQ